jgi:GT2 family glycosyltransferase
VVVPAYQRIESTRRALASLAAEGAGHVVLVDDEGSAGSGEFAGEFPRVDIVVTKEPVFWAGAIVLGIRKALERGAPSVLFFNQDVTFVPGSLARLAATSARHPDALVGCAVLYAGEPSRVWSAGGRVEWWGRGIPVLFHGENVDRLPKEPFPVDWLFGMGTLVPSPVFSAIGLPDAETFPMSWGDTDFSLRARRAGLRLLVDPGARLLHEVGGYDARAAGPPSARTYVGWMRSDSHNLSLKAHAEIWRRYGPRFLWPLSYALRVLYLLLNYVRIRVLFPGEGNDA